jgi:hypothetical protein
VAWVGDDDEFKGPYFATIANRFTKDNFADLSMLDLI